MARMEAQAPARAPGPSSWNSRHPLKYKLMSTEFSREAEVIWESGCQRSPSDLPCSIQQHRPHFLASSQQRRAAKTNKCRHCAGYGCMNSTILCWPTLAPLFQAMNRAVWGEKFTHEAKAAKFVSLWWFQDWVKKSFFTWCYFTYSFTNRKHFLAREEPLSKN